jgi:hypothetical protein
LRIGPDAGDARAAFRLSLRVSGDRSNKRIWLRLNHVLLPDAAEQGDWYRVDLPIGVLRCGTNELSVWCGPRDPEDSERSLAPVIDRDPIIVHQVFVEARY